MAAFAKIVDPGDQHAVDPEARQLLDTVDDLFWCSDKGIAAVPGLEVKSEIVDHFRCQRLRLQTKNFQHIGDCDFVSFLYHIVLQVVLGLLFRFTTHHIDMDPALRFTPAVRRQSLEVADLCCVAFFVFLAKHDEVHVGVVGGEYLTRG